MSSNVSTRRSIQILPRQLANQIAAGEVVERPASVAKELLENSLDAGATEIIIDIDQGGTNLIRIRDNGSGIPKDELALAISRHATSKIRSLDDLEHIHSMGFRGEALASIASVSDLQITSRTADDEMAWSIHCVNDSSQLQPAAHPVGTTVEVARLFFNTPARRHFLKSERTEYRHVEDVVRRVALARFDVSFQFRHNQRSIWQLPACATEKSRLQRLSRLLDNSFLNQSVSLEFNSGGMRLWGWAGLPEHSRSQADTQFVFINQRMIRDRLINHALRQAYGETLHPGRFPVYVLFLELDPSRVDVNVHPTKHEVRFREARLVHDFLQHSLQIALTQVADAKYSLAGHGGAHSSRPAIAEPGAPVLQQGTHLSHTAWQANPASEPSPLGQLRGWLDKKLMLLENDSGLAVIHVGRARQQWLQRQYMAAVDQGELIRQPILVPLSFHVSQKQLQLVKQQQDLLGKLGFEMEPLGEEQLVVRHIPAMLRELDLQRLVQLLMSTLENASDPLDLIASLCRAAETHPAETSLEASMKLLQRFASLELSTSWYRQISMQELLNGFGHD